jgi:hypothetical protein
MPDREEIEFEDYPCSVYKQIAKIKHIIIVVENNLVKIHKKYECTDDQMWDQW